MNPPLEAICILGGFWVISEMLNIVHFWPRPRIHKFVKNNGVESILKEIRENMLIFEILGQNFKNLKNVIFAIFCPKLYKNWISHVFQKYWLKLHKDARNHTFEGIFKEIREKDSFLGDFGSFKKC